jgi:hypothetical protein
MGQLMDLVRISREAKSMTPVFIVGEARSGSTILYRTLLSHSSFAPRQEIIEETGFIRQAPFAHTFSTQDPAARKLWRYMVEDDDSWQDFLTSLRPIRPLLRPAAWAQPALSERVWLAWRLAPSRLVARSYVVHAQRARGSRRILEKTPRHIEHVKQLFQCFPKAKLLYIHRHPVDVYSSYVRRGQIDPKADWARISPEAFCRKYRRNALRALRAATQRPHAVLLLSYESFTDDPRQQLRRICDFLGERFEAQMLANFDVGQTRWAHWEGSTLLYQQITPTTKDWRDYLSPADARRIENLLHPEMTRFGYQRHVPSRAHSTV